MATPPARLAAAASNVVGKVLHGGVADLRPVPRVLIDQGPNRSLYRLTNGKGAQEGPPVLLVPPLAAPALCFDLRRGCSLAEHLVEGGRNTYLVDYGNVAFSDRRLGIEHWIEEVLPRAIRKVSEDSGGQGVHVVAWCLGGIFSLLTTADQPDLPIESIATIASPFDFTAIPLIAPFRPLVDLTGGHLLTPFYRALGGAPSYLVSRVFRATGISKEITKPLAILKNLDDRDYLAQIEAVDHFMDNMIAYPGRTFGQIYHRFFRANDLAEGTVDLNGRIIALSGVKVPTLVIAGQNDTIAPRAAVERLTELLDNSPSVTFETAPGGHLGVLTGRKARGTTWRYLDRFLDEQAA
ncbi:alpha/beta hydrolase [Amycolatopsis sp. WAC 04169]|uniref:Polyhydroxyalkanoate synthase n=2 Tax=Amycolatopsis keratiniphila TaxID=129921 RepID=R4T396_9PSEU|nr:MULTISPECIES: alpha/beta fold hydrolase [Amycolatopsis]AGM09315.1 polyhydroxyalkanoate synthase [Amycolatopsis keratiniphila]ONF63219.1 alpha/beta hydrolase [Amycolatopsis keratiniphila subsp. keratiniphila]RSN31528.1 alpha/beta hydrolase [Amycolatopsis sp. WAC 04169]